MGRASRAKRDRRLGKATDVGWDHRRQLEERERVLRQAEVQRRQREDAARRRAEDLEARQQARAAAAEERRATKALAAKAERAKRREAKLAATAARQAAVLAARGPWGGARQGAGRPRVHATNAERQAAYRARRRQETT